MQEIAKKYLNKIGAPIILTIAVAILITIVISLNKNNKSTEKTVVFKSIKQKKDIINFKKFILNQIR